VGDGYTLYIYMIILVWSYSANVPQASPKYCDCGLHELAVILYIVQLIASIYAKSPTTYLESLFSSFHIKILFFILYFLALYYNLVHIS